MLDFSVLLTINIQTCNNLRMKKDKTKVLIIDDDPKVGWILSEGLSANFNFVTAGDGIEGIQMVSTEKPDLILLDIKMPGMTGLEVLEKLNKVPDRPEVIMLSGHGETKNIVQWVNSEKSKLDEVDRDAITVSLKVDVEAKRGLISDVETELRKANARRVLYSANQKLEL